MSVSWATDSVQDFFTLLVSLSDLFGSLLILHDRSRNEERFGEDSIKEKKSFSALRDL